MNNNDKYKTQVYITSLEHQPVVQTETFESSELTDSKSNSLDQNKNTKPANETFLDFFIEKETSFADFGKISTQYESLAVEKYHQYNKNLTLINEKKKEYDSLLQNIEQELVAFLQLTQENFDSYYENILSSLHATISQKKHEISCYNNTFKRLYKENYLIKKRLEQEMKYEQLNSAQYEKYAILKNHALLTVTKQTQMLNNVILFQDMSKVNYEDSIKQKTIKYNQVDFQVLMIKKDTIEIEKKLESYKKSQMITKQELKKIMTMNHKYKEDYIVLFVDYLKIKVKLMEIYNLLKVKDLGDIIKKFTLQKRVYQSLSSQFADANKEIAATNNELTELTNRLKIISSEILKKSGNIPIEYINDYINKLKKQYAEVSSLNNHLICQIQSKRNKLKLLFVFLIMFIKKIHDSMMIPAMTFGFTIPDYFKLYEKFFTIKNNDVHFNSSKNIEGIEYAKLCLRLFTHFNHYVYLIFSNCFNTVFTDQLLQLNNEYEVFAFDNKQILITYDNSLKIANTHWDKKEKIFKRGEKDILSEEKTNNIQNKYKQSNGNKAISKEQLYLSYVTFLKEKKENSGYIKNHPRRSIVLLNTYANNLVENTQRKKSKNNFLMTYSSILKIETTNKDSEANNSNKDDYDSYTSTPKKRKNPTRNKKDYRIQGITAYPEMDKIYSRLNDLRTLELHYFKAKDKHLVSNSKFNEIYFTFKKKFFKDKSRNKSLHNRGNSMNIPKLPNVTLNKEAMCPSARTNMTNVTIQNSISTPRNIKRKEREQTYSSEYFT